MGAGLRRRTRDLAAGRGWLIGTMVAAGRQDAKVAVGNVPAWRQDMTITREEFLRTLGITFAGSAFVIDGDEIRCADELGAWRILISPLPDLEIGQFRLARQRITIHLAGYDPVAAKSFLDRFELNFRRGGG